MVKKIQPQTPAERKRAERARKRDAGLVLMPELWVMPAQRDKLMNYVGRLAREAAMLT